MSRKYRAASSMAVALLMGFLATALVAGQGITQPAGKLVLFGDLNAFVSPTNPNPCTARNRYKKGETVGFRLFAVDGGTGDAETSAEVIVHITSGGRTYDLPTLFRGVPHKTPEGRDMPIRPGMWTAKWIVPDDAPTGTVDLSATARDKFGRTAQWKPLGGEPSFLTIVQ
jgi:hypothetical protein